MSWVDHLEWLSRHHGIFRLPPRHQNSPFALELAHCLFSQAGPGHQVQLSQSQHSSFIWTLDAWSTLGVWTIVPTHLIQLFRAHGPIRPCSLDDNFSPGCGLSTISLFPSVEAARSSYQGPFFCFISLFIFIFLSFLIQSFLNLKFPLDRASLLVFPHETLFLQT